MIEETTVFWENPNFIAMVVTILAWGIFHAIVYFIAAGQGLQKDILRNAKNLSNKGKKIASNLGSSPSLKDLRKICHLAKRGEAILQVYLLENGENVDVDAARKRLERVHAECRDVARAYRLGDNDEVALESEDVVQVLKEAEDILVEVLKERENNRLMKV